MHLRRLVRSQVEPGDLVGALTECLEVGRNTRPGNGPGDGEIGPHKTARAFTERWGARTKGVDNGERHRIERNDAIGAAMLQHRARHTPHDTCRFVLGEDRSTCLTDGLGAIGAVRAHASQDRGDGARTEMLSHRVQGDVH